jgi:hypothetical protein
MDQNSPPPPIRPHYLRRAAGTIICLGPAVLLIVSLVYGILSAHDETSGAPIALAVVGLLVAFFNAYLSLGRGLLHRWRHGSMVGYRHISGLPGIGTFLVTAAVILGFGSKYTAIAGLVALMIDTGGLPWFLVATWRDGWLWDGYNHWKIL